MDYLKYLFRSVYLYFILFCRIIYLKWRASRLKTDVEFLPNRKLIKISYTQYSQPYNLYLPYHRSEVSDWIGKRVYVEKTDKKERIERIEITQQPGIPYFVRAEDFDGERIIIVDENDQVIEFKN